jgi:hypothetical protein
MSKKNPQNQPFFHILPFKTTHFFFPISPKFNKKTKKKKKKKKKKTGQVAGIDSGTREIDRFRD